MKFSPYTDNMYLSKKNASWTYFNLCRQKLIAKIVKKYRLSKKRILEVGAYDIYGLSYLLDSGAIKKASDYSGLDIYSFHSPQIIKLARKNLLILKKKNRVLKYKLIDSKLEGFKTTKKFDAIFLFETLEHVENEKKCIDTLKKIVKRNGLLIISVPIEKYFGTFIKEIGRKIILKRCNYSWREIGYFLLGKMDKVRRKIGSHVGYDYDNTLRILKRNGFKVVYDRGYPVNIKYFDYGKVFVLKKDI